MPTVPAEIIPDSVPSSDDWGTQPEKPRDPEPRPDRRRLWMIIIATLMIASVIAFISLKSRSKSPAFGSSGSFASTNPAHILRLKGTTEAVQSRAILAPLLAGQQVPTLTIVHMTPGGTRVKRGDPLVEFDRQAQIRDYIDKQAEYSKLAG